eukprot:Skav224218  [mRNA]  locus=scaffold939:1032560:1035025:- [translate_table: standard]
MEWLEATARRLEFLKRKQRRAPDGSELDGCRDQSVSCNDPKPEEQEKEREERGRKEQERQREKERKRESSLSSGLKRETKRAKVAPPNKEMSMPRSSPIILKPRSPSPETNFARGAATTRSASAFTSNLEKKASPGRQPKVGQKAAHNDFSDTYSYHSYYSSDSEDDKCFTKATLNKHEKMLAELKGKSLHSVSSESKKLRHASLESKVGSDAGSAPGLHHTLSSDRGQTALEPVKAARTEASPRHLEVLQAQFNELPQILAEELEKWGAAEKELASEKEKRQAAEKQVVRHILLLEKQLAGEKEKRQAAEKQVMEEQEKHRIAEKQLAGEKEKRQAAEKQVMRHILLLKQQLASEKEKRQNAEKQVMEEQEKHRIAEKQLAGWKEKLQAAEKEIMRHILLLEKQPASEKEKRQAAEKQAMEEEEKRHIAEKQLDGEKEKRQAAEKEYVSLQEQLDAVSLENEKLKAQLQTQKSISCLGQGASWLYENDGCWHEFTREGSDKMHQAYLEYKRDAPGNRVATINSGGVARTVDFELMQQKHCKTQKVRKIRFSPGVPSGWVTPALDLLQQGNNLSSFYKEVTDQSTWDSIRVILQNSGHALDASTDCSQMRMAEIKSVHRIEHFDLWHRYKARLGAMRQDHARYSISVGSAELDLDGPGNTMAESQKALNCGEDLALDVDEKILLHGTSWKNANAIVREGFDNRTCQHAFYGAGVYFACAACKSHQYTCEHHKSCCGCKQERTLIIARVALGDAYIATETRKKHRRPPNRSDASGTETGTYDSIVVKPGLIKGHHNQNQIHQEFVIFDGEQAYPSYVVQYTV